jgi:D-gamma-glutamyl-meso-diaminopimelic acid endopeptidase CwlS
LTNEINTSNTNKPKTDEYIVHDKITHEIKQGESLWLIARNYDIHVSELLEWNNLKNDKVRPGQKLEILRTGSLYNRVEVSEDQTRSETKTTNRINNSSEVNGEKEHTVKEGESLWIIARNYNTRVVKIMEWNNLSSDKVYVGQKLKILK